MKFRIGLAIFLFLVLLICIPISVGAEESSGPVPISEEEINKSMEEYVEQSFGKVGLLPDSNFYFFKKCTESLRGLFIFGKKKTNYRVGLSQKRLREAFALIKKGKIELGEKTLTEYVKILEKVKKKDLKESRDILGKNYPILQAINIKLSGKQSSQVNNAFALTAYLINKINEQLEREALLIETREYLQGKVIEKNSGELIMEWESKKIEVRGLYDAKFIDKSGKETGQDKGNIEKNSIIAVYPLNKEIKFPKPETKEQSKEGEIVPIIDYDGWLFAEKIVIGGR